MKNNEHEINNKNFSNKNETNKKITKQRYFCTKFHRKTKNQYFTMKLISEIKRYKTLENNKVFLYRTNLEQNNFIREIM